MTHKNPLGKIKDVAVGSLKAPVVVAGSAVDLAKGAAATGGHVTKTVAGKAAGAVTSLVGGGSGPETADSGSTPTDVPTVDPAEQRFPTAEEVAAEAPEIPISPDEPVNVTEALDLDPAPVDKPKRPKKAKASPATTIDAQADPSAVDVTPADVADVVGRDTQPGA